MQRCHFTWPAELFGENFEPHVFLPFLLALSISKFGPPLSSNRKKRAILRRNELEEAHFANLRSTRTNRAR